jgi:hypothetical protein
LDVKDYSLLVSVNKEKKEMALHLVAGRLEQADRLAAWDTWSPGHLVGGGWPARSLEQADFLLFILNLVIWVGWMTVWDKQTCFCFFYILLFVSCDCLCEL